MNTRANVVRPRCEGVCCYRGAANSHPQRNSTTCSDVQFMKRRKYYVTSRTSTDTSKLNLPNSVYIP
jgi:hypothetical protein